VKGKIAYQVASEASPEKWNAGLEVEAIVDRQELRNEEMKVDTIGSLEDRYNDQRLVVWHC
jgi:hypothetical protein